MCTYRRGDFENTSKVVRSHDTLVLFFHSKNRINPLSQCEQSASYTLIAISFFAFEAKTDAK